MISLSKVFTKVCSMKIDLHKLKNICKTSQIKSLHLVGSVARGEETKNSDVDLLVEFHQPARSPLTQYFGAKKSLEQLFARKVDLIEKSAIKNQNFFSNIIKDKSLLYEER